MVLPALSIRYIRKLIQGSWDTPQFKLSFSVHLNLTDYSIIQFIF